MNAIQKQTSPQKKREFAPRRVIGIEGHGLTQIRALVDIPSANAKKATSAASSKKNPTCHTKAAHGLAEKPKRHPRIRLHHYIRVRQNHR